MSKQSRRCRICNTAFLLLGKEQKLADPSGDFICSRFCLLRWISEHKDKERLAPKHIEGHVIPCMSRPDVCYSPSLKMSFRSRYEMVVAGAFYQAGLPFEYEKHGFLLDSGIYIPDFFLIKEKVIIEVKGLWGIEGKRKIKEFRKCYPDYPLLVVTWLIRKSFDVGLSNIGDEDGCR